MKGVICVGRATRSCKNGKIKSPPLARWPPCYLKYVIGSRFSIKHTVRLKCTRKNQYAVGKLRASKCCIQFWGLPGTKLPWTTSLYAHHPSWIFGGFGCAVRLEEETEEQAHQLLESEIQARKRKHDPTASRRSRTETLHFFSIYFFFFFFFSFLTALIISRRPANLLSKRPLQTDSLEMASEQTGLQINPSFWLNCTHTHTHMHTHTQTTNPPCTMRWLPRR